MRLTIVFLLISFCSNAQINSLFVVSDSSGCVPVMVSFSNQSTGSGTLTYYWDFGNGQTSPLQNPWSINYLSAGTYTVSLTVSNGIESDTFYQNIYVFSKPSAGFTLNGNNHGCIPFNAVFNDGSVSGSAPIDHWNWEFGTNDVSTVQDPIYEYTVQGVYSVILTVTDTNNCTSTYIAEDYINVSLIPVIDEFIFDPLLDCTVPATITFTSDATGLQPLDYLWSFGDGSTGNGQNTQHTYNNFGSYEISLTVSDPNQCSIDSVFPVNLVLDHIDAFFGTTNGNNSFCLNEPCVFTVNHSLYPLYWNYGDGTSGNTSYHNYANPGIYNVTMISRWNSLCADTITIPITVYEPATPSFSCDIPQMYSCQPVDANFNYNGMPVVEYNWQSIGPGVFEHSFLQNTQFYYESNGIYNIQLITIDANGCRDTVIGQFEIFKPEAIADILGFSGCVPVTISYDASTSISNEPIVSYEWDFGDGTTSSSISGYHTYTVPGNYTISLSITNSAGCSDIDLVQGMVGDHANIEFSVDDTIYCSQELIHLINNNPEPNVLYSFIYYPNYLLPFGLPIQISDFVIGIPSDTCGFTIYTDYFGCHDEINYNNMFSTIGPSIDSIKNNIICTTPGLFEIYLNSYVNAQYFDWYFGDSTSVLHTQEDSLQHLYTSYGIYYINVIAYDTISGCVYSIIDTLSYSEIFFNSLLNCDSLCINQRIDIPYNSNCSVEHIEVYYNSQLILSCSPYYNIWLGNEGMYHFKYYLNDLCNTPFDLYIYGYRISASISVDTLYGCGSTEINFSSITNSIINIINYQWDFGNSEVVNGNHNITYTYAVPGMYLPILTITDSLGCEISVSLYDSIELHIVNADFVSPIGASHVCLGNPVALLDISTGNNLGDYEWDFGSGDVLYTDSLYYYALYYGQPGFYDVSLIVHDTVFGCTDTLIQEDFFEIQEAVAEFMVSNTDTNCYPFRPIISNLTPPDFDPVYFWDYHDGYQTSSANPVHTYTHPGDYWLTYSVSTSRGCIDSDSVLIHVGGPFANIIYSDTLICKGDQVNFNIVDSVNIYSVNWNFGDGAGSSQFGTSHNYYSIPSGGEFYISLIYCSETTCCLPIGPDTLHIYEVVAEFTSSDPLTLASDSSGCSPFALNFNDASLNATSRMWDFGNGQTSQIESPTDIWFQNNSSNNIVIPVSLIVQNDIGCSDTLIKNVIVYANPELLLSNDMIICIGQNANLVATGGTTINWWPPTGLNDTLIYNPVAHPDSTTMYYATVYNDYGCYDTDSVKVSIQSQPQILYSNDTSIVIGETVLLFCESSQPNCSYLWVPLDLSNCSDCQYIFEKPLHNTIYNVIVTDSLGCYEVTGSIFVEVKEFFSLDMPTIFTPGGDGINDKVYVKGWGIMSLIEYSIYNRWGERVYFSDDISQGWDGTYNGVMQPIDTYSYYVKVVSYSGKTLEKKGNITLIR